MKSKTKARSNQSWEEKMEREANEEAAREKARAGGSENRISIKDRKFALGGELIDKETKGKRFKGVVVDFVYERAYYDEKFDEDNPGVPRCFAITPTAKDMAPHENVAKPCARVCEACEFSQWGSGRGRGQACGDRRRLAVLHIDDAGDADAVADATLVMLSVPPTSTKHWAAFVKAAKADHSRPYYAVECEFSFDPDAGYAILNFEVGDELDEEIVEAIMERREEAREMLLEPYDTDEEDDKDEDDKPRRKKKRTRDEDDEDEEDEKPRKKKRSRDEDEEDKDEEDEEDEEDEDEEDEKPTRRKKKPARAARRSKEDEEDEEDEEGETDDDDDEPTPRKRRGSRFGR